MGHLESNNSPNVSLRSSISHLVQTYEPEHYKSNKMTCAPSEDSDQPGHLPSLIRVFAVCFMGSVGLRASSCRQGKLMPRLIRVFTGCTGHFVVLLCCSSFFCVCVSEWTVTVTYYGRYCNSGVVPSDFETDFRNNKVRWLM